MVIGGNDNKKYQVAVFGKDKPIQFIDINSQKVRLRKMFCQRINNAIFIKSDIIDDAGKQTGMYLAKFNLYSKKIEFEHSEKYSPEFQGQYYDKDVAITMGIDKTVTLGVVQSETGRVYVFDQKVWTDRFSSDNSLTFHTGDLIISCIDKNGKLIYREKLLKLGKSSMFDRLAFIPVLDGDKLHILFQDNEENLNSWTTGEIKIPGLKSDAILSDAIFDPDGKQTRVNTNLYDQKSILFIRTDHSTFVNQKTALLMLFNRNKEEGKFVEVEVK